MLSCDSEIPGTHRTNFGISFAEVVTVSPVSLLAAEKVAPYFRLIRYYDQNGFILDASNDFASVLSRTADSKEDRVARVPTVDTTNTCNSNSAKRIRNRQ